MQLEPTPSVLNILDVSVPGMTRAKFPLSFLLPHCTLNLVHLGFYARDSSTTSNPVFDCTQGREHVPFSCFSRGSCDSSTEKNFSLKEIYFKSIDI